MENGESSSAAAHVPSSHTNQPSVKAKIDPLVALGASSSSSSPNPIHHNQTGAVARPQFNLVDEPDESDQDEIDEEDLAADGVEEDFEESGEDDEIPLRNNIDGPDLMDVVDPLAHRFDSDDDADGDPNVAASAELRRAALNASIDVGDDTIDATPTDTAPDSPEWSETSSVLPLQWPKELSSRGSLPLPAAPANPFVVKSSAEQVSIKAEMLLSDPDVTVPLVFVRGTRNLVPADEEVCLLCGSTGCADWQLICYDCGECFHSFCLSPPVNISRIKPSPQLWRCPHCKFCESCRGSDQEDQLIVCDSCDRCYHLSCLDPPLQVLPTEGWRCAECAFCIHCGVNTSIQSGMLCAKCAAAYSVAVAKVKEHVSGPNSPLKMPRLRLTMTGLFKRARQEKAASAISEGEDTPEAPHQARSPKLSSVKRAPNNLKSPMLAIESTTPAFALIPPEISAAAPVTSVAELQLDLSLERSLILEYTSFYTFSDAAFLILEKARRPISPALLASFALAHELVRPRCASPVATMQSNISIETTGRLPRFRRFGRGLVALSALGLTAPRPIPTLKELSIQFAKHPNIRIAVNPVAPPAAESTALFAVPPPLSPEGARENLPSPHSPVSIRADLPTHAQISSVPLNSQIRVQPLALISTSPSIPEPVLPEKNEVSDDAMDLDIPYSATTMYGVKSEGVEFQQDVQPSIIAGSHGAVVSEFPGPDSSWQETSANPKKRPRPEGGPPIPRRRRKSEANMDPLFDVYRLLTALAPFNAILRGILEKLPAISADLAENGIPEVVVPPPDAPMDAPPAFSSAGSKPDPTLAMSELGALISPAAHFPLADGTPTTSALYTPVQPTLLWRTRGRPRKDGLPKLSTLQLSFIAQKCDLAYNVLTDQIRTATKLRTRSLPPPPLPGDFDSGELLEEATKPAVPKRQKKSVPLVKHAKPDENPVPLSSATAPERSEAQLMESDLPGDASGEASHSETAAEAVPIVLAVTSKPTRVVKPKTTFNMYSKSAFTSDFGFGPEDMPKKPRKQPPPSGLDRPPRRSAREAASGLAAAIESESVVFVEKEARRTLPKRSKLKAVALPSSAVGTIFQARDMVNMCAALDSPPPIQSLLSPTFDATCVSSLYEVDLLRKSELIATELARLATTFPQLQAMTELVSTEDSSGDASSLPPVPLSIYSTLSNRTLDIWDRKDAAGTGASRRCYLCADCGDYLLRGRLIQVDVDVWVHVNCISWSYEVFETDSGDLLNVPKALDRGKITKCKVCNTLGATVNCRVSRCPCAFHFSCAIRANCKFNVGEHTLQCEAHAHGRAVSKHLGPLPMLSPPTIFETPLWGLLAIRRVAVDPDAPRRKLTRRVVLGLDNRTRHNLGPADAPQIQQHRVGALTVSNLGRIVWEFPAFKTQTRAIPADYAATRKFWSWRGSARRRTLYHMEIVASSTYQQPLYRISCGDDPDASSVIQAWSPDEAWMCVVERVNAFRQSLQAEPIQKIRASVAGEIYFGFGCPNVIKYVEQLPNLRLISRAPHAPYIPQYRLTLNFPAQLARAVIFSRDGAATVAVEENPSGCARTEPFKKLNAKQKFPFGERYGWHPSALLRRPSVAPVAPEPVDDFIREQDALAIAQRYFRMKERELTTMRVMRSPIHEWGVFAMQPIKAGDFEIEYVGELIRSVLADYRERYYDSRGIGCYMFRLDTDTIIDATMRGNMARFINHCCEPNSATEVIEVHGKKHIIIYATKDIAAGEELTYDYMFSLEDDSKKIPCYCGARRCRGWMN